MRPATFFLVAACALTGAGGAFAQAAPPLQTPDPSPPILVPQDPQQARCERLLREFAVSSACYARFRTVKGIKGEAFERCGPPVADPRGTDCPLRR
jgi:hypothetical protein